MRTDDLSTALVNNYIGEVEMIPSAVADAVSLACTGQRFMPFRIYYYGAPDEGALARFGYVGTR